MKILAIDTSTEACSAALMCGDEVLQQYKVAPRMHAELLLPMIDQLLAESNISLQQLDALAFGRGPGAFTGVRVATGVIQGLAYAADLPVAAISSLAILAQSVADTYQTIIPAFDARMNEVYIGRYAVTETGVVELVEAEQVIKPELLNSEQLQADYALGSGWQTYSDVLTSIQANITIEQTVSFPSAEQALPLAQQLVIKEQCVSAAEVRPVYLRNKVTF